MMETPTTLNSGMCRCCSSEGTFKDIKTKYHWMGEEEIYADMLNDCFDIKILTPEDTDNGICEVCITQLRNAANFKKQVLHTEEQFKQRFCNKDPKNPIKLESADDEAMGSDHLSDADFSGAEYEVPIKQEVDEKPKAKKRPAKATTSRTKKAKSGAEASDQHQSVGERLSIKIKAEPRTPVEALTTNKRNPAARSLLKDLLSNTGPNTAVITLKKRKAFTVKSKVTTKKAIVLKKMSEFDLQMENLKTVMRCSNATPAKILGLWYKCSFCHKRYEDPATLKTHTLDNHLDGKLPFVGRNISELAIRLDITGLQCTCCELEVGSLEQLIKHLSKAHSESLHALRNNYMAPFTFDDGKLRCGICELEFHNSKMLFVHMNNHYDNFTCDECSATFMNQRSLYNHVIRHANGQYKCEICKRMFDNPIKLKDHTNSVHRGLNKRNKCDFCEARFNCIVAKRRHLVAAHGVALPEAQCPACDKTFKSNKYLAIHQRTYHMMERRHKCPDCEKTFFSKNAMKRHMLTHSGLRSFKCIICSKAYGRNSTLREHMRIHADDRRFKCKICGLAFVQKCSWKGHMRSKHGEEVL